MCGVAEPLRGGGPEASNCWLSRTEHPATVACHSIDDWTQNDIFKYLGENGMRYCPLYDAQLYSRTPFRVSTPIHTGSAKRLDAWRSMDPDFHQRVTAVFPDMFFRKGITGN